MDLIARINEVLDYIEQNIEGELDTEQIEKIVLSPRSVFQSMFVQVSGISLSEYVRRRKLTLAAFDLQNSNLRVIDVSLKYGYASPDAFRVAFHKLHGVNPSEAKNTNVFLKFYSRLEFQIKIKGVKEMDYKLAQQGTFTVVGVRAITPYGGGTWAIVKRDGSLDKLKALANSEETLGLCFGFDEDGKNDYMCGVETDNIDDLGFDSFTYPELKWLVFLSEGKLSDNVLYNTWQRINNEFMPNSKYTKLEYPTIERYIEWDEKADKCKVEIRIPVS